MAYGQINVSIKHTFVEETFDEWERERITKDRLRRIQTAPGRIQSAPEMAAEHEADGHGGVATPALACHPIIALLSDKIRFGVPMCAWCCHLPLAK